MIKIPADELRAGDVVDYGGRLHRVRHIDRRPGWSWPVAAGDGGWAIALGHDLLMVRRTAV